MPDTYSYCCRLPLQLLQYNSDDHDHHHHSKRNPSATPAPHHLAKRKQNKTVHIVVFQKLDAKHKQRGPGDRGTRSQGAGGPGDQGTRRPGDQGARDLGTRGPGGQTYQGPPDRATLRKKKPGPFKVQATKNPTISCWSFLQHTKHSTLLIERAHPVLYSWGLTRFQVHKVLRSSIHYSTPFQSLDLSSSFWNRKPRPALPGAAEQVDEQPWK